MRILKLREVKWFTQGHTTCKHTASSQTSLLTPNSGFFPLSCCAFYVSYVFFSPEILFWTSFQRNFDGINMHSNATDTEQATWKRATSQSGQCLSPWNPGTADDQCEMASSFSTCLSTAICLFFCCSTHFGLIGSCLLVYF